jgi:hypothetical protein
MGNILVGRGDVELVAVPVVNDISVEFIAFHELSRWKREVGAIAVSPAAYLDFSVDLPPCADCYHFDLCRDMAADSHSETQIQKAMESARAEECTAIDAQKLKEKLLKFESEEELRDFADGA